jgi:hypothetical protein
MYNAPPAKSFAVLHRVALERCECVHGNVAIKPNTAQKVVCLLFGDFLFGVNQEAAGIHVLLTRSLFGDGILRRLLLRVSLAKLTSAPVRC